MKINILFNEFDNKLKAFLLVHMMSKFQEHEINLMCNRIDDDELNYFDVLKNIREDNADIVCLKHTYGNELASLDKALNVYPYLQNSKYLYNSNKENVKYNLDYVPYQVGEIFYNKNIFSKYNLKKPENYDDFLYVCKVLKENNEPVLGIGGKETWLFNLFVKMIKEALGCNLTGAYMEIKRLINKGYIESEYLSTSNGDCIEAFYSNKLAMICNLSYCHLGVELRMFEQSSCFLLDKKHVVSNVNEFQSLYVVNNNKEKQVLVDAALYLIYLYNTYCYMYGDYRGFYFDVFKTQVIATLPYDSAKEIINDLKNVESIEYLNNSDYEAYCFISKSFLNNIDNFDFASINNIEKNKKTDSALNAFKYKSIYVNNNLCISENLEEDCKCIEYYATGSLLIDYPRGIQLLLPSNLTYDFSLDSTGIKGSAEDLYFRMTLEHTKYDTKDFIDQYVYKYYRNKNYLSSNKFETVEDNVYYTTLGRVNYVCIKRNSTPLIPTLNYYIYITITLNQFDFISILYRTDNYEKYEKDIKRSVESLSLFKPQGKIVDTAKFEFKYPRMWNLKTRKYYDELTRRSKTSWGCFHPSSHINYCRLKKDEEKMQLKFDAWMTYVGVDYLEFDINCINEGLKRGQDVVFTFHCCSGNNTDTFEQNDCFDMIEGKWDEIFKKWARKLKQINGPFILRFSNEMNTDWTKYAGSELMSDPNNFITIYRRFYDICEQEGVDNAIFIMNGYDTSYPPLTWNDNMAYFPGVKYCHMMGITGYNHGEYNTYEHWRNFNEIYEPIMTQYHKYLINYNYVVGEFGSTSIGGDKNKWLEDCFIFFKEHPEIKIAIWFNFADFDGRVERSSIASRPFWLDEKDEYLQTFKKLNDLYNK